MFTLNFLSKENGIKIVAILLEMNTLNYEEIKEEYLSKEEILTYESILYEKRKLEYLYGRVAGKVALSELAPNLCKNEVTISNGILMQPYIKSRVNNNVGISLSHDNQYAAAIAYPDDYICGIDVETIEENRKEVINRILTTKEKRNLEKNTDRKTLLTFMSWTAKEALSKALKTGLTTDMKYYEISDYWMEGNFLKGKFTYFSQYEFISFQKAEHLVSVVVPKIANFEVII